MKRERKINLDELGCNSDKIRGRTLTLHRATLKPSKNGKAYIIPLGDMHIGYPTVNYKKIKGYVDYCVKNSVYVIGMGDYLECGTTKSIGNSVYAQQLNPQAQLETFIDMFRPLAGAGLLLGLHGGNHEERIMNVGGIDITKIACKLLGVKFFGFSMHHLIRVGKINYKVFSTHGSSGAQKDHTKIQAVINLATVTNAELILMGHVHKVATQNFIQFDIDVGNKMKFQRDKVAVVTGHFLEYEWSYAEMKNMIPSKTGAVKISLCGNEHSIHASA